MGVSERGWRCKSLPKQQGSSLGAADRTGVSEVGSDGGFTVKRSMVLESSCTSRVQSILNLGGNTDIWFALN